MEYRQLGGSGFKVPVLSFGTGTFGGGNVAVATETGKTVPQIALNWLLQRPTVASVIVGARDEAQLRENLGAVGWSLSAEQIRRLDQASAVPPPYPYWHQRSSIAERTPPPV